MVIERADVEVFSQVCQLIYHFGYNKPGSNVMLHNLLVTKLAQTVEERMEANRQSMRKKSFNDSFFYGDCEILFRRC